MEAPKAGLCLLVQLCVVMVTQQRSIKYNVIDLNDDFYSEIRNLLKEHLSKTVALNTVHPQEVRNWPREPLSQTVRLGEVSGVAVTNVGQPVVLHRGSVKWDDDSFNSSNHYQHISDGPIQEDTILVLDPTMGQVRTSLGRKLFYMPHGLTIDRDNNMWVTDVAQHQVFKLSSGTTIPSLILGTAFEPGDDDSHFCQPTDVAVASSGVFFVADGYCNSRIMKYSPDGKLVAKFGKPGGAGFSAAAPDQFNIPHSLVLFEDKDLLCVADRENQRISCFRAGLLDPEDTGKWVRTIDGGLGRVFAITGVDNTLYAVNGPSLFGASSSDQPIQGFTIDVNDGTILDTWGPSQMFEFPHDIQISPDRAAIYVTEIEPNRVWKFLLEEEEPEYGI